MNDGLTLQVNLAVSDRAYAQHIIPALARSHRAAATEILITIDGTKPQKTKLTDPAVRCPEPQFSQQVAELVALAESWQKDGIIDRVLLLQPNDPWLAEVTRKYSGPWLPETHDYGGRPITGYWAGIEAAHTRYVVHYDGDMFLYQEPGFDWAAHAVQFLTTQELALSACPRLAPPFSPQMSYGDYGSLDEGMWMHPVEGGWKQFYFSTRAFVVDREKLERHLPVGRGAILREQLLVKVLRRGFPRSAEKMWWSTFGKEGGYRLILATEKAWLLHPNFKPPEFPALVPAIIEHVNANRVPDAQRGHVDIDLDAWRQFLGGQA